MSSRLLYLGRVNRSELFLSVECRTLALFSGIVVKTTRIYQDSAGVS